MEQLQITLHLFSNYNVIRLNNIDTKISVYCNLIKKVYYYVILKINII